MGRLTEKSRMANGRRIRTANEKVTAEIYMRGGRPKFLEENKRNS